MWFYEGLIGFKAEVHSLEHTPTTMFTFYLSTSFELRILSDTVTLYGFPVSPWIQYGIWKACSSLFVWCYVGVNKLAECMVHLAFKENKCIVYNTKLHILVESGDMHHVVYF